MVDRVIKIGERFGVPVMLLIAGAFFLREACVSIHATLLVPIVKSHVEFLESTSETLHEIDQTQAQQALILGEISIGQRAIQQALSGESKTGGLD
jgi:hypothetical protein